MCGIFAVVGQIEEGVARHCLDRLQHRGPDGSGLWRDEGITLGHRRLSILDLSSDGAQPMHSACGRYAIVFNGEIYNFIEIRKELTALGHDFHSESDTEVLLAAFLAWGEGCLTRFNGMWSFVIWNKDSRTAFFARDRLGKKPLFYIRRGQEGFAFASEMKALLPLMQAPRPDLALVHDISRLFTYESTEACVVEGILRVRAGHCGWIRDGRMNLRRWWNTLDHLPEVPVRYEDQVEQFRAVFLDACRIRMRSDVPLGTALSGGLDSSATLAAMRHAASGSDGTRLSKNWQHAFVAAFPGTPIDETPFARRVADHLGVPMDLVDIDVNAAIGEIDKLFYLFEDLYITSPIPFMMTYRSVKQRGVSVTLDGHGADELFAGYPFDYLIALKDAGLNVRAARDIVDTYYAAYPVGSSQFRALPPKSLFWGRWHLANARAEWRDHGRYRDEDAGHPAWHGLGHLNRRLYRSTHETVLPTLLRNYDRYSMSQGVEIRMPFLDHRILTLAFALPWTSKVRGGFSKAIIRDAVADLLPHDIAYRRTKIGFNSPVVDWMKGPMRSYLQDTLASQAFRQSSVIDQALVTQAVRHVLDHPEARFSDGERAWSLLSPFFWERALFGSHAGRHE